MLDQIKRKRLNLINELGSIRPRINSSQKRKQIQANLQKFKKDVQQSKSNSPFQSANNFYPKTPYQQMKLSPTIKDLVNPFIKQPNQLLIKKQEQSESLRQSPRFKQSFHQEQKQYNVQQKNNNNSIQHKYLTQSSPPRNITQTKNKVENIYDTELQNIQLNNDLISQNQDHKLQRQVSFGNEDLQKTIQKLNTPKSIENNINNFAPSYEKKQQNILQLNFNYNQSNYGGSSNGSSAIFFTSQFRDYLNNGKKQPQKNQQIQPISQKDQRKNGDTQLIRDSQSRTHTDKQIGDSFLKIGDEQLSLCNSQQRTKKLLHNQSGRSLAFSNNQQSLLKQSKANEYTNYQDIVNKKLDEELVLQISHFGKNKLKDLIQKYILYIQNQKNILQQFIKQLRILAKLSTLKKQYQFNLKRYCFDGFLILKDYKFNQIKNQIKADNHLKEYNQKLLQKIFFQWKQLRLQQEKKIINYSNQKDQKLVKNIYQVLKMIWFDYKVKRQVDLYYLSKIFSSFKNAVTNDRKKTQSTALKQYCRSIKRLYFYKLIQGAQNAKKQRLNQQLAQQHYRAISLKKFFHAWLEQCDQSPQYVSLTMTSKNLFKQTLGNKWLGIKTVDFKQLKQ